MSKWVILQGYDDDPLPEYGQVVWLAVDRGKEPELGWLMNREPMWDSIYNVDLTNQVWAWRPVDIPALPLPDEGVAFVEESEMAPEGHVWCSCQKVSPAGEAYEWRHSVPMGIAEMYPEDIIKCAYCDKPAVRMDCYWPYHVEKLACADHLDAWKADGE